MLVHATVDKMTAMHLTAMAEAFQRQLDSGGGRETIASVAALR